MHTIATISPATGDGGATAGLEVAAQRRRQEEGALAYLVPGLTLLFHGFPAAHAALQLRQQMHGRVTAVGASVVACSGKCRRASQDLASQPLLHASMARSSSQGSAKSIAMSLVLQQTLLRDDDFSGGW